MRAAGLALVAATLSACAAPLPDSSETVAHFAKQANFLRSIGRFRTDYDPPDAPVTAKALARDFEHVAFNSEYGPEGESRRVTPIPLWKAPPQQSWALIGPTVDHQDTEDATRLFDRLADLTGVQFRQVTDGASDTADIAILFMTAAERARWLSDRGGPGSPFLHAFLSDERWPCIAVGYEDSEARDPTRRIKQMVLIRDEVRGLYRRSCIEEEVVQSLGLPNDGDFVRPSMFNDDEEFALMTRHDELMLQILYDDRLRPGMQAAEGMPIVREIIAELGLED